MLLNARSIFNKSKNLAQLLKEISPDICLISETFERRLKRIDAAINNKHFKAVSYYRKNRAPGGGCAIIYSENRFSVTDLEITAPAADIENCWALLVPKYQDSKMKVKRIAIGSYYVSPRSKYKQATIDHIIETIQVLRAKYSNDIHFIIGGDFNRLNINDILDSYGALKQVISVPTRHKATLEIILTDLHTMYHPLPPSPPSKWTRTRLGLMGTMRLSSWPPQVMLNLELKDRRKPSSQDLYLSQRFRTLKMQLCQSIGMKFSKIKA